MNEQTPADGAQVAPDGQPQAGTATAPVADVDGAETTREQTISLEEARKLRSEARSLRERLKALEEDKARTEEAKLTDTERLTAKVTALEKALAEKEAAVAERTVLAAAIDAASRLGFANPKLAYRLLDRSLVEFDADGQPTNIDGLLRTILKDEPYLAAAHARASGSIDGGTRGASGLTEETIRRMTPAEYAARRDEVLTYLAKRGTPHS